MRLASHLSQLLLRLPAPRTRDVTVRRGLRIPLPDGTVLLADHWTPATGGDGLPTMLCRTPYGRTGTLGRPFAERGFQALVVSVRGTVGSGGRFQPQHNERADGLAVLDWLWRQPWFDGRVALHGASYVGYTQWAVAADAPRVAAMVPHVTSSRLALGFLRPGAYALDGLLRWSALTATQERFLALLRSPAVQRRAARATRTLPLGDADLAALGRRWPFYADTLAHATDDPLWADGDFSGRVGESRIPAGFVAGWYDIFLIEQLRDYRVLRDAGTATRLTVGPWVHSSLGGMRAALLETLDWAGAHARGEPPSPRAPVRLYVQGLDRWRDFESWPPPGYRPTAYHLHPDGVLDRAAPDGPGPAGGGATPDGAGPSHYRYDPADPTPSVGGALLTALAGRRDQRRLEARADVLTFSTAPLDASVDVIGEVHARVWLRSSRPHADLFVRLCDVNRRGRSRNVTDALVPVRPDGVTEVPVQLAPTAYRFRRGHRIRVQVSSGAFPRFARNPGTGEPLATAVTLEPADQEIFHDRLHPSAITLPVRERAGNR